MVKDENILKKSGEWLLKPTKEKKYFAGQSTEQAQARHFPTENRERMQEQDYLAWSFRKLGGGGGVLSAAVTHAEGSGEIPYGICCK